MEIQPAGTYNHAKQHFDIGSILSRTFKTFFAHPIIFLCLGFMCILPTVFFAFLLSGANSTTGSNFEAFFVKMAQWIVTSICQGIIAVIIYRHLRGENIAVGESIKIGINRIFALTAISFLVGLLFILGLLFLLIPGMLVFCIFSVSIPACIVERLGPIESMKRSIELVKNNFFDVFVLFIVLFVGYLFFAAIMGMIAGIIMALAFQSPIGAVAVIALIPMTWTTMSSIMVAIIYYDLRRIKEGVSVDALANIFE